MKLVNNGIASLLLGVIAGIIGTLLFTSVPFPYNWFWLALFIFVFSSFAIWEYINALEDSN